MFTLFCLIVAFSRNVSGLFYLNNLYVVSLFLSVCYWFHVNFTLFVPFSGYLSDYYIVSRVLFVPSFVPFVCHVIIPCTCKQFLSLFDDHVCKLRENWKPDHSDVNRGSILSFDATLPTFSHFLTFSLFPASNPVLNVIPLRYT